MNSPFINTNTKHPHSSDFTYKNIQEVFHIIHKIIYNTFYNLQVVGLSGLHMNPSLTNKKLRSSSNTCFFFVLGTCIGDIIQYTRNLFRLQFEESMAWRFPTQNLVDLRAPEYPICRTKGYNEGQMNMYTKLGIHFKMTTCPTIHTKHYR